MVIISYMVKQCILLEVIQKKIGTTMSLKCLIGAIYNNQPDTKQRKKALKENPQVTHVVGHSLGGSVALQLEKDYSNQIKTSRTYGAPVLDAWKGGNPESYRHYADPVSILDRSSHMTF